MWYYPKMVDKIHSCLPCIYISVSVRHDYTKFWISHSCTPLAQSDACFSVALVSSFSHDSNMSLSLSFIKYCPKTLAACGYKEGEQEREREREREGESGEGGRRKKERQSIWHVIMIRFLNHWYPQHCFVCVCCCCFVVLVMSVFVFKITKSFSK